MAVDLETPAQLETAPAEALETEVKPEIPTIENPGVELSEIGLQWSEAHRALLDPETGEMIRFAPVEDDESAKAACYSLMCNTAAIAAIDKEIKALQGKKKARQRRETWLKSLFSPGLVHLADKALAGKTVQSVTKWIYAKVGYKALPSSCEVLDKSKALSYALVVAPTALKLEIDMAMVPQRTRKQILDAVLDPWGVDTLFVEGVAGDVRVSYIPIAEKAELPADAFKFRPGGEKEWYVTPTKPSKDAGE